jgi:hypothetical protein
MVSSTLTWGLQNGTQLFKIFRYTKIMEYEATDIRGIVCSILYNNNMENVMYSCVAVHTIPTTKTYEHF